MRIKTLLDKISSMIGCIIAFFTRGVRILPFVVLFSGSDCTLVGDLKEPVLIDGIDVSQYVVNLSQIASKGAQGGLCAMGYNPLIGCDEDSLKTMDNDDKRLPDVLASVAGVGKKDEPCGMLPENGIAQKAQEIFHELQKSTTSNVILVGPGGMDADAVIETLALRISGKCPEISVHWRTRPFVSIDFDKIAQDKAGLLTSPDYMQLISRIVDEYGALGGVFYIPSLDALQGLYGARMPNLLRIFLENKALVVIAASPSSYQSLKSQQLTGKNFSAVHMEKTALSKTDLHRYTRLLAQQVQLPAYEVTPLMELVKSYFPQEGPLTATWKVLNKSQQIAKRSTAGSIDRACLIKAVADLAKVHEDTIQLPPNL